MKAWWFGAAFAVIVGLAPASAWAATPDPDPAAARRAVEEGNWAQAIAEWQQLYTKGERDAAGQLCRLYFDARNGSFDLGRIADWCRRAAGNGDAAGLYRLGMLYLVGLGVDRDAGHAQALCAAAAAKKSDVPAGFCLAAVSIENDKAARDALQPPAPPAPADTGHAAASSCDGIFAAPVFDPKSADHACQQAAAAGDPEALEHLGLMRLFGIAGAPDLAAAEADCTRAKIAGASRASGAFCLAAVAQLRQASAGLAISRHTGALDVNPTTGMALPKTAADPYAADRILDMPHTTATGLAYTCRQISLWALYEAPGFTILKPRDTLFGRPIIAFRPADFAALDEAAAACDKAVAPADPRRTFAPAFATFRRSLVSLRQRQAELLTERQRARQDSALIANVDRDYRSSRSVTAPLDSTAQESACIERVRRSWQASGGSGHRSLEIRDTRVGKAGGRFAVYGTANVLNLDSVQHDVVASSIFSCTFDDSSGRVTGFQLLPGFTAMR